jgi:hypothetical protein
VSGFSLRVYFSQELDALLVLNGFSVGHKYSDYDLSPFTAASPKLLPC